MPILILKRRIDFYNSFKQPYTLWKLYPFNISYKSWILPRIRGTHGCFLVGFDPFRPLTCLISSSTTFFNFQNPAHSLYGLSIAKWFWSILGRTSDGCITCTGYYLRPTTVKWACYKLFFYEFSNAWLDKLKKHPTKYVTRNAFSHHSICNLRCYQTIKPAFRILASHPTRLSFYCSSALCIDHLVTVSYHQSDGVQRARTISCPLGAK